MGKYELYRITIKALALTSTRRVIPMWLLAVHTISPTHIPQPTPRPFLEVHLFWLSVEMMGIPEEMLSGSDVASSNVSIFSQSRKNLVAKC